jgi:hypothetical protein
MDYQRQLQRQLQREQKQALKQAMKLNEQMEVANNNMQQLNKVRQSNIGIPQVVLDFMQCMIQNGVRITRNNVIQFYNNNAQYFQNSLGQLTDEKIKLIMYTNKLAKGEQSITDEKDLKKLLKTVSLNRYKIGINDLKIQKYKVYLTNFKGETIDNIHKAFDIFKVQNQDKTLMKIAQKQKASAKPVSYLVGVYSEWDTVSISNEFREFQKNNQATIDIIIQVDKNEITAVPKYAIIKNIKEEPFTIYNSRNTAIPHFYEVESLSASTGKLVIRTDIKPVIKYRGALETRGLKIAVPTQTDFEMGKYKKGEVRVQVDRGYYSLCNRYIITGTLKPPMEEVNLGYYKMLAKDGTTVYVSARLVPYNKSMTSGGIREQRIYYLGFDPREIDSKLMECTKNLQKKLGGYVTEKVPATAEFTLFKKVEKLGYDE